MCVCLSCFLYVYVLSVSLYVGWSHGGLVRATPDTTAVRCDRVMSDLVSISVRAREVRVS